MNSKTDSHITGIGLGQLDVDVERDPPAPPTPLSFPRYPSHGSPPSRWSAETPPPTLWKVFSRITKHSDIDESFITALNVQACAAPSDVDDLLPSASDTSKFYPTWELDQNDPLLHRSYNPLSPPGGRNEPRDHESVARRDFLNRLAELQTANKAAFQSLNRSTPREEKPVRLVHLRKFFTQLENVSQYWDASEDRYFTTGGEDGEADDDEGENGDSRRVSPKRRRLEPGSDSDDDDDDPVVADELVTSPSDEDPSSSLLSATTTALLAEIPETPLPKAQPRIRYTGLRLGAGKDMPETYRTEILHGFLEPIVWRFGCTITSPRMQPVVQLHRLNLPARQTAGIFVLPKDLKDRRGGIVEGPVMGVCGRAEVAFGEDTAGKGHGNAYERYSTEHIDQKSALDLLREIGALLLLAQERRRQGRAEVKPGEGKWWTERPRWGGVPGPGETKVVNSDNASPVPASEERKSTDSVALARAPLVVDPDAASARSSSTSRRRSMLLRNNGTKRKSPLELWREVKPGRSMWDPKIRYRAVGRAVSSSTSFHSHQQANEVAALTEDVIMSTDAGENSSNNSNSDHAETQNIQGAAAADAPTIKEHEETEGWDDVYLISCLSHHISVVRLRVHSSYLAYLESGEIPASALSEDNDEESAEHWSSPQLRRSQWFDLLDVEQRIAAFRLVWAVVAYLMRDEEEGFRRPGC